MRWYHSHCQHVDGGIRLLLRKYHPEGAQGVRAPHLSMADGSRLTVHALRALHLGRLFP